MADERGPKIPSVEELLEMIETAADIPEEEKQSLKKQILGEMHGQVSEAEGPAAAGNVTPEVILVLCLFLVVAAIIGGLAVKLILKERERARGTEKKTKKNSGKTIAKKERAKKAKSKLQELRN